MEERSALLEAENESAATNYAPVAGQTNHSGSELNFKPFDQNVVCPRCHHHMLVYIQPLHLKQEILCPECMLPLNQLFVGYIQTHTRQSSGLDWQDAELERVLNDF
ncbi:MAG: hypothetical protein KDK39_04560 [Leptospiraceae bacterium]|nr:hypothetical protein [Leptospiraceae bacterium]